MPVVKRPKPRAVGFIVLAVLVVVMAVLRLLIDRDPGGALGLALPKADYAGFRIKAIVLAGMVGSILAVSGVLLQALLRNPLASPFILGLSSGAGLGVMAWMYAGYVMGRSVRSDAGFLTGLLADVSQAGAATTGAIGVLIIVFILAQRRRVLDPLSLVLVGVVIAAMCNAGMMILELLVPNRLRGDLLFWMMGNIRQGVDTSALVVVGVIGAVGIAISIRLGRAMDAATLGDDEARSVGVGLGRLRLVLFVLAGALAAAAVAVAGPIGFVGLIAPHAARLLVGPAHAGVVIAAALCGAAILIAADAASQAIELGAGRIPVGVFTAIIGGPAFLWLLRTGRGQV